MGPSVARRPSTAECRERACWLSVCVRRGRGRAVVRRRYRQRARARVGWRPAASGRQRQRQRRRPGNSPSRDVLSPSSPSSQAGRARTVHGMSCMCAPATATAPLPHGSAHTLVPIWTKSTVRHSCTHINMRRHAPHSSRTIKSLYCAPALSPLPKPKDPIPLCRALFALQRH